MINVYSQFYGMYCANYTQLARYMKFPRLSIDFLRNLEDEYENYSNNLDDTKYCNLQARFYRSKKEIFSSAQCYCEAEVAKDNGCIIAYYFLCYYSLFHAMQAVLFLNVVIPDGTIKKLSHNTIVSYFNNFYCDSDTPVYTDKIVQVFKRLKTIRELYSYGMPLNSSEEENINLDNVKELIIGCFQLASLHSEVMSVKIKGRGINDREIMISSFKKICTKKTLNSAGEEQSRFDEADYFALEDMFLFDTIAPFVNCFEHEFDEYNGYSVNEDSEVVREKKDKVAQSVWNFIYFSLY